MFGEVVFWLPACGVGLGDIDTMTTVLNMTAQNLFMFMLTTGINDNTSVFMSCRPKGLFFEYHYRFIVDYLQKNKTKNTKLFSFPFICQNKYFKHLENHYFSVISFFYKEDKHWAWQTTGLQYCHLILCLFRETL